jgi:hypothetical protein
LIVAEAYLATTVCLAVLFYFAGRERHQTEDGFEVYRYPRVAAKFVLAFAVVFPMTGAVFVYETFHQKPRGGELALYFGVWGMFFVFFQLGYLYLQRFQIKLRDDRLEIRGFRTRIVDVRGIRRFVLVQGGRGGQELSVYDGSNVKLLTVSSSIQDFGDLVTNLRARTTRSGGVRYESRDMWGKWTRQ